MKCIKYIGQNGWAIFLEVYKQKLHFNIIWPERERESLGEWGQPFSLRWNCWKYIQVKGQCPVTGRNKGPKRGHPCILVLSKLLNILKF